MTTDEKVKLLNPKNRFIYYPSLSSGASRAWLEKNTPLNPESVEKLTGRFYNEKEYGKFTRPFFLLSAGHKYKNFDLKDKMGLNDSLVIADSGGFQIATGAMKYEHGTEKGNAVREKLFLWLENNSDVAVNLDVPPRFTFEGRFNDCLQMSVDNFKYFESKQTGKTQFLNVLQGNNPNEYEIWYDKVKDFEFNGWCIGGARRVVDLMYAVAMFLREGEFGKAKNKWMHVLGVSKISDFVILAALQKQMNIHFNSNIVWTTDSSSPGQYPVYGVYLHSPCHKQGVFSSYHFKPENVDYPKGVRLPCAINCPACRQIDLSQINKYDETVRSVMVVHNTFIYHQTADEASDIMDCPIEIVEDMMPSDLYDIVRSIQEMFDHPDKSIEIYKKYYQTYISFSGNHVVTKNNAVLNEFFTV